MNIPLFLLRVPSGPRGHHKGVTDTLQHKPRARERRRTALALACTGLVLLLLGFLVLQIGGQPAMLFAAVFLGWGVGSLGFGIIRLVDNWRSDG